MKSDSDSSLPKTIWGRVRHTLLGSPRDLKDPSLEHKISLIAFLAWVGLGADGLSSSAYGPEEAYRALGSHTYLAVFLVLATALTVFIISYAYSRIIEHFPLGGGGYVVASKLLGKSAGVVSGCALFVDYILTITVSVAGGGDALFSLLPLSFHPYKLWVEFGAILFLIVMNIRGVKESVEVLIPIFLTFVATHFLMIGFGIFIHAADAGPVVSHVGEGLRSGVETFGKWGLFLIFLRAYSLGAGTYTGIEAVSNGVSILREPRVETGKRTMAYMAISLAVTAGGLLFCYMLVDVQHAPGKTLNAVLAGELFGGLHMGFLPAGHWLALITIFSEAVLLLVAAQTGFIDGPRVMANMALDSWLPRRFSALSDRLTMQNGILLIGVAAALLLGYTQGHIGILVVMYSVNVFLTFSLSQLAMIRFWIRHRKTEPTWKRDILIHGVGFVLCFSILCVMIFEKFREGAWITVAITLACIVLCFVIRGHYFRVSKKIREIDQKFENIPSESIRTKPVSFDEKAPTAVLLVGGSSGLGVHIFLNIFRLFASSFKNVVFVSIGVVDSEFFKGNHQVDVVTGKTQKTLQSYVEFSERMGIPARSEYRLGAEVVETASQLCLDVAKKYPRSVFFAGELVFEKPQWYHHLLHNETAYAILRRIRFSGLPMVILPIRLSAN